MTRTPYEPGDGMPEENDNDPSGAPGGFDELALRRMLHDAVRDMEPKPDALLRIDRAIPARRARRAKYCQAAVGLAVGALLVSTAMPAVLHLTDTGSSDTTPGALDTPGGLLPGVGAVPTGGPHGDDDGGLFGQYPSNGTGGGSVTPGVSPPASLPGIITGSGTPVVSGPPVVATPACARVQLGDGSARTGPPDPQGRIYGSFRVVNVSGSDCTVAGPGQIDVTPKGTTDASRIQVVEHTQGDPAAGLPDPAGQPDSVTLPPGQAYQVQFAWIPAPGGGTTGCATAPVPPGAAGSASPSAPGVDPGQENVARLVSTAGDDGGGGTSVPPPDSSGSPTPSDTGIALADVPTAGGSAAATTAIGGACAGTVYRTAPLPSS